MTHLLNQAGNSEDVRNSVKTGFDRITLASLRKAMTNERENQNRSTVLKILQAAHKKKLTINKKKGAGK